MSDEFVWLDTSKMQQLSLEQHGWLAMLLGHVWKHGYLPRERAKLAAIAGVRQTKWVRLWRGALPEMFCPDGDVLRLVQPELDVDGQPVDGGDSHE